MLDAPLASSKSFESPCVVFVPTKQLSKIQVTDVTIVPIATSIALSFFVVDEFATFTMVSSFAILYSISFFRLLSSKVCVDFVSP